MDYRKLKMAGLFIRSCHATLIHGGNFIKLFFNLSNKNSLTELIYNEEEKEKNNDKG